MRYLFLDTETVGFKPFDHGAGVCEICVTETDENFNILSESHSLIDPEGPISPGASGVHGIRDRDVVDSPTLPEWLNIVLPYDIFGADQEPFYFIAHNSKFDAKFLHDYIGCDYLQADTLKLARRLYPEAPDHKLQTLRVWLDLPFDVTDAHSALGDVRSLIAFVKRMSQDSDLTLDELCILAQEKEPPVLPFGKYRGQLISDIVKQDRQYLNWVLTKMDGLQDDTRKEIEAEMMAA